MRGGGEGRGRGGARKRDAVVKQQRLVVMFEMGKRAGAFAAQLLLDKRGKVDGRNGEGVRLL